MGTKNNPGQYDCYANAEPDEPMFVLLGRDKHAPTLVWLWATLRELEGEDPKKVAEARACCLNMMAWAKEHDRKVVGLGQAGLAAVMDMIRSINSMVPLINKDSDNQPTGLDAMRIFLTETYFEKEAAE